MAQAGLDKHIRDISLLTLAGLLLTLGWYAVKGALSMDITHLLPPEAIRLLRQVLGRASRQVSKILKVNESEARLIINLSGGGTIVGTVIGVYHDHMGHTGKVVEADDGTFWIVDHNGNAHRA